MKAYRIYLQDRWIEYGIEYALSYDTALRMFNNKLRELMKDTKGDWADKVEFGDIVISFREHELKWHEDIEIIFRKSPIIMYKDGQIDVFDFLGDIKKEIVQEEKKVIRKKKSSKSFETFENIEGQITAFDLVENQEEEVKVNFTKEQLETIEKLKEETEWIEYSLYKSGMVIFITKENKIKVISQRNITSIFYIKDRYRSYFLKANGEVDSIGIGITKWKNPVKTMV